MVKGAVAIIGVAILVLYSCQSKARVPQSQTQNLVIEGTVEKIGTAPGVGSGFVAVYQFAKYRISSVCEGEYDQAQIVVDHLILEGNELDEFRSGDKVRLTIKKSKTILHRYDEEGFRNASDKVDIFYVGEKPKLLSQNCVSCEPCR